MELVHHCTGGGGLMVSGVGDVCTREVRRVEVWLHGEDRPASLQPLSGLAASLPPKAAAVDHPWGGCVVASDRWLA